MSASERIEAVRPLWWVFVLLGVVEIAGSIAALWYESSRGKYGPVLRNLSAIAVSDAGEIFVYADYSEIRVFEPDGRLSRTWPVETLQGGASIAFSSEERLEVFAWRGDRLFLFDTNGRLLHSETLSPSEATKHLMSGLTRTATSPSGDSYEMRRKATGHPGESYELRDSEIVRLSPTGPSTVVVPGPPSYLWLFFQFPFGPFVFLSHGAMVILFGLVARPLPAFEKRQHA